MAKPIIMAGFCLWAFPLMAWAEAIKIENAGLLLQFEWQGSEIGLSRWLDKKDGFEGLVPAERPPLWEVDFCRRDAEIQTAFRGGEAGRPIDFRGREGDLITLDSLSCGAEVSCVPSGPWSLEWVWDRIKLPDQSLATIKVTVELPAQEKLSLWRIAVNSHSEEYALWQIRFPQVQGLTRDPEQQEEFFLLPAGTGQRNPGPVAGAVEWIYPSSCMGMQMSAYLLARQQKGFFFACYDGHVWQDEAGNIGLFFVNASRQDLPVSYSFDPAQYGLDPAQKITIRYRYPERRNSLATYPYGIIERSEEVKGRRVLIVEVSQ